MLFTCLIEQIIGWFDFCFRDELSTKITGEDRRELMELQYQVTDQWNNTFFLFVVLSYLYNKFDLFLNHHEGWKTGVGKYGVGTTQNCSWKYCQRKRSCDSKTSVCFCHFISIFIFILLSIIFYLFFSNNVFDNYYRD